MKYKILLVINIIFGILPIMAFAEPLCDNNKYSIVFINGMLNERKDFDNSLIELRHALELGGVNTGVGSNLVVHGAFNPSHIGGLGDALKVVAQKAFDQNGDTMKLDYDAKEMLTSLSREVKEGRILFVPHSQGNFYANIMTNWIANQKYGLESKSMSMYNVASPAQYALKNSKYILSKNDKIISGLVGSVGNIAPPNVEFKYDEKDPNGHNFIDIYLKQGGDKIVKEIKQQLKTLEESEDKKPYQTCIPAPKDTIWHNMAKSILSIADPVAEVLSIAEKKNPISVSRNIAEIYNVAKEIEQKINPPAQNADKKKEKEIVVAAKEDKTEPVQNKLDYETQVSYLNKIIDLKKQLDEVNSKQDSKSNYSGGGGGSVFVPNIDIGTTTASITATSTKQNSSSTIDLSTTTPPLIISTSTASTTTSTSTPGNRDTNVEDVIKNNNITEDELLRSSTNRWQVSITELYRYDDNYASWIEITNFNQEKYADMRGIYIEEGDKLTPFPVNAIPPGKIIVLRNGKNMIHSYNASTSKLYKEYVVLSDNLERRSGYRLVNLSGDSDRYINSYVPLFCYHLYGKNRSCEFNRETEMWYYSVDPENPDERENTSTIGSYNNIEKYFCFRGDYNKKHLNEDSKYMYGNCHIEPKDFDNISNLSSLKFIKTDEDYYDKNYKSKLIVDGKVYFEYDDRMPRFSVRIIDGKYYFPDNIGPVFPYLGEFESTSTATSTQVKGFDENGCFNGNFEDAKTKEERESVCGNGWVKRNRDRDSTGFWDSESRSPEDDRYKITRFDLSNETQKLIVTRPIVPAVVNHGFMDIVLNGKRYPIEGKSTFSTTNTKIDGNISDKGNMKLIYSDNIFEPPRVLCNIDYDLSVDVGLVSPKYKYNKGIDVSDGYLNVLYAF